MYKDPSCCSAKIQQLRHLMIYYIYSYISKFSESKFQLPNQKLKIILFDTLVPKLRKYYIIAV